MKLMQKTLRLNPGVVHFFEQQAIQNRGSSFANEINQTLLELISKKSREDLLITKIDEQSEMIRNLAAVLELMVTADVLSSKSNPF